MSTRSETPPVQAPRTRVEVVKAKTAKSIGYLFARRNSGPGAALLSQLRSGIAREPGSIPAIWDVTLSDLPGALSRDEPDATEWAVHHALALWAHHQRAKSSPMHQTGVGVGRAVRALESNRSGSTGEETSPTRRRFDAAVLSRDELTLVKRLRPLMEQLRGGGLATDYVQLAGDLYLWHFPQARDSVRRRWAREYYRFANTSRATVGPVQTQENDS